MANDPRFESIVRNWDKHEPWNLSPPRQMLDTGDEQVSETPIQYDYELGPEPTCSQCVAWYAEAQRALFLLVTLAEDHFPDQPAFDEWIQRQNRIAFYDRPESPEEPRANE